MKCISYLDTGGTLFPCIILSLITLMYVLYFCHIYSILCFFPDMIHMWASSNQSLTCPTHCWSKAQTHRSKMNKVLQALYKLHNEKTGLQGFRPGPTNTGLYSLLDLGRRGPALSVMKTKALISCAVTVFVST